MKIINSYVYDQSIPLWDTSSVNGSVDEEGRTATFSNTGAITNQYAKVFSKSSGKWLLPFQIISKPSATTLVTFYWENSNSQTYGMYLSIGSDGSVGIGRKYSGGTQFLGSLSAANSDSSLVYYVGVDIDNGVMFVRYRNNSLTWIDLSITVGSGFAGSPGAFYIRAPKQSFVIKITNDDYNSYPHV